MNRDVLNFDTMTGEELNNILVQAEQGDAESQFIIGEYYNQSTYNTERDVDYDYACKEAAKWFHKAAEQGNAYAQFRLWNYYGLGIGVRYNEEESNKWYRKAADQGLAAGQCAVALDFRISHNDNVEAAKWFLLAAEQGHEFCMNEIAYCYRNGIGVEKNDAEADKWYKRLEEMRLGLV